MFQIDLKLFKQRTWREEQVLFYMIWTGNARILNMPEYADKIPNVGKYDSIWLILWMPEYVRNITCLNKPGI